MSRRAQIIFFSIYALCFLGFFAFGLRPSNIKGLLLLPCGFLFFCICILSLAMLFRNWKSSRFWAIAPLAACLLMLPIEGFVARFARNEIFNWRFPRYEALVQKIESGAIPVSTESQIILTSNYDSSLAEQVSASRQTNGVLTVFFLFGGAGSPPFHELYLYISS
jgi:hypothetical protein